MKEEHGRITINRYAKKETRKKNQGPETSWYLYISRLYSGGRYYKGEYKIEKNFPERGFTYDITTANNPMGSSLSNPSSLDTFSGWRFFIAVRELIIEWDDYQREVSGYIHCKGCADLVEESRWLIHSKENSDDDRYKLENNGKQLLRFVKSPGLKNTNMKIKKEDLEFFPIDLNQCDIAALYEEEHGKCLQVRREHHLECEIRPLFDNEPLPIKYAHITVDVFLQ